MPVNRLLCTSTPAASLPLRQCRCFSCRELGRLALPIPRQEFVESVNQVLGNVAQHVGEPSLRIDVVHLGGTIRLYMNAARSPPRSEPANNHARRPRAIPRTARSAALLERQMRPSSRNRANAAQRLSM